MLKDPNERNAMFLLLTANLFYFLTYVLGFYPLVLLTNMAMLAICLGGAVRVLRRTTPKNEPAHPEKHEFVSAELIADVLQVVYTYLNGLLSHANDILLWAHPEKSFCAIVGLYIVGMFVRILPLFALIFMGVWGLCGWICFQKQYYAYAHPYVNPVYQKVCGHASNVYGVIPRFKESQKL